MAPGLWNVRQIEWGIFSLLLVVLIAVFGYQVQVLQGQAERGAVQSTLGALRVSLVLDHVTRQLPSAPKDQAIEHNPFLLLGRIPANYAGELPLGKMDQATPGTWVFDPVCVCVGYRLLYPRWLEQPPDNVAVWFHVDDTPGGLQLSAFSHYVWQGQVLQ